MKNLLEAKRHTSAYTNRPLTPRVSRDGVLDSQTVNDKVTMDISAMIVTVGMSANDCLMSCEMQQIYPTTGLVNSPNGLLTFH